MIHRKTAAAVTHLPSAVSKLFVLDTNVLMHDPTSLFRFEEHDLYVPMATLEELDNHKQGMSEVARNARQASRYLDEMITRAAGGIVEGIPLETYGDRIATGRLFLQTESIDAELPARLASGKADNQILGVREQLEREAHLALEALVRLQAVARYAVDVAAELLELRVEIAELLTLGGAARGVVFRVEVQDEGRAFGAGEAEGLAAGGGQLEIGCWLV